MTAAGRFVLGVAASLIAAAPATAWQDPAGVWVGEWERDGSRLAVEVKGRLTAAESQPLEPLPPCRSSGRIL